MDLFRQIRSILVSIRLTVVLLAMSIVLVFWATLDQVNLGVWGVQHKFFHAFLVMVKVGDLQVPVYPGGYLIGSVLLLNLLCAHVYRFKLGWRKTGIWIVHAGLILLLLGELVSGLVQREFQMRLDEGESKNYSESSRQNELAIIDTTDANFDDVVAIPESMLAKGTTVQSPKLPFRVVPRGYYPNAEVGMKSSVPNAPVSPANAGMGPMIAVTPVEVSYKEDERNTPAAYVEFIGPDASLGTYVVSTRLGNPQTFDYAGRSFKLIMRPVRHYQPFSLTLEKFSHDIFPGTDIDRNFSSKVKINMPDGSPSREFLIYMNNPLRYQGLTYYQASYDGEHTTILQVVRNPSWLVPYISCGAIALGLIIQFLIHLVGFARKRRAA
ncbi:MAG TPA: cytochrome c biogenesis protein ResB [Opitutaceae bacterium]